MDPTERHDRIRQAKRRLSAQRRRNGILRSRAITVSLLCFALLWAVVFVQMATGNDPVLGAGRRATATKPARPEARTDSEEAGGAGAAASEAIETTAPEEIEPEAIEPEPVEVETVEPEVEPEFETVEPEVEPEFEPEPVPVETAQS